MRRAFRTLAIVGATVIAIGGTAAFPEHANAAWHGGGGHWHGGGGHWHGGGLGWGGFGLGLGTGLALGAAPYYGGYYGYGPYAYNDGGCYLERRLAYDGYGHRVWRRVRVCY